MRQVTENEFWVTNISQRDVALGDLRISIRRGRTVNLLDKHHYKYTLGQLKQSAESGSLKIKGSMLKIREVQPEQFRKLVEIDKNRQVLKPIRNKVEVTVPRYEELDFDKEADEAFADETAEAAVEDNVPLLPVDPKFKKDTEE